LLSSFSEDKERTSDFATQDDATQALYTLDTETVMGDLQAIYAYASTLEASNGKTASVGFCR
jgi:carboxymethylenebutenolidase